MNNIDLFNDVNIFPLNLLSYFFSLYFTINRSYFVWPSLFLQQQNAQQPATVKSRDKDGGGCKRTPRKRKLAVLAEAGKRGGGG